MRVQSLARKRWVSSAIVSRPTWWIYPEGIGCAFGIFASASHCIRYTDKHTNIKLAFQHFRWSFASFALTHFSAQHDAEFCDSCPAGSFDFCKTFKSKQELINLVSMVLHYTPHLQCIIVIAVWHSWYFANEFRSVVLLLFIFSFYSQLRALELEFYFLNRNHGNTVSFLLLEKNDRAPFDIFIAIVDDDLVIHALQLKFMFHSAV